MTDTTTIDPFDEAIETVRAAKQAAQQAAQADAKTRADAKAEASAKAKQLRQIEEFRQNISACVSNFRGSVARYAAERGWSESAILAARDYCNGLVDQTGGEDVVLPNLCREMKDVIHRLFVEKVSWFEDRLPAKAFYGQKQDWFTEAKELNNPREQSYRPQPPKVKIPKPGEEVPTPARQEDSNVVPIKSATTPKGGGKRRRPAAS